MWYLIAAGYDDTDLLMQRDIFLAHPVLTSRVYEAAARRCIPQTVLSIGNLPSVAQVINGLSVAAAVCEPSQLPAQTLLTITQLASRMGSQVRSPLWPSAVRVVALVVVEGSTKFVPAL